MYLIMNDRTTQQFVLFGYVRVMKHRGCEPSALTVHSLPISTTKRIIYLE